MKANRMFMKQMVMQSAMATCAFSAQDALAGMDSLGMIVQAPTNNDNMFPIEACLGRLEDLNDW